jgi:hypothetical protein
MAWLANSLLALVAAPNVGPIAESNKKKKCVSSANNKKCKCKKDKNGKEDCEED